MDYDIENMTMGTLKKLFEIVEIFISKLSPENQQLFDEQINQVFKTHREKLQNDIR